VTQIKNISRLQILRTLLCLDPLKYADNLWSHPPMIVRKLEALFTINTNAAQFRRATEQLDQFSLKEITCQEATIT